MFSQNAVVCIKVNGKILRESKDTVSLPFSSEYSILVKNLNSVRAQVAISVDGQDATEKTRLIIQPNSTVELERFIKGGDMSSGARFKFIERTPEIEAHRGIQAEDGLVRVEFWKELVRRPAIPPYEPRPRYPLGGVPYPRPRYPMGGCPRPDSLGPMRRSQISGSSAPRQKSTSSVGHRQYSPLRSTGSMQREPERSSDAGITVPGSQSNQQFQSTFGFPLEPQSTVITLRLRGDIGGEPVVVPVTVKDVPVCRFCGLKGKAGLSFCGRCGAGLL